MLSLDALLIAVVFVVWAVLAVLYAAVEAIAMPPATIVWGAGAALFLALAIAIARAEAAARRRLPDKRSRG